MARFVNVAAVQFQSESHRGAPDAADVVLEETRQALESLRGYHVDLVLTSEGVEAVGQTVETAEEADSAGPFLEMYMDWARSESCHVAGSVKLRDGGNVHNSIAFINPEGEIIGAYHKSNLTRGEIESGLTSGRGAVVLDTDIGRLGGLVCFDLNFEWLRQEYRVQKPDILCFASMYHGGLMQQMWAYDCRAYFVTALPFMGCGIFDPFGQPLNVTDCYTKIARATINLDRVMVHLDYNRERFPEIEKTYFGEVIIDIPPNIGPAIIYSLSDSRTAVDIAREFELQLIDDYLTDSLKRNAGNRPEP